MSFVSRAGDKLDHALNAFKIDVRGLTAADFGASTGGFVDCLLQRGATKVFAVETGYGTLDWSLRNDPRVVVMERENAMHVQLPESVDFLSIDTSWTKLKNVLPNALKQLKPDGRIVALLKPHYEAKARMLRKGKLAAEFIPEIIKQVQDDIANYVDVQGIVESPVRGEKGGNAEFLLHLLPKSPK